MNKTFAITGIVFAAGCLSLSGCTARTKGTQVAQTPTGMHQIEALYDQATEPQRRAVRKPTREKRARAMRALAIKAEQLATETEAWESDAHLMSIDAADRDEVRVTVATFRGSLEQLRQAAERRSITDLRRHYGTVATSYRRLAEITETVE